MQEVGSRKRPHMGEPEPLPSKKRAVSVNGSAVLVNGNAHPATPPDDEPRDQDDLEQFRKEAIFRRMRHYARENERSQARIAELERLKGTYEASLAVMGACWTQLVDTIRAHVKPDISPSLDEEAEDLFSFSKHTSSEDDPTLAAAFEDKARSTHKLVAAFVQMNGGTSMKDDMFKLYQRSQTECTFLRSELELTRANLKDCQAQRDRYHSDLATAETRLDRQQSRTVQAVHARAATPPKEAPVKGESAEREEEDVKEEERKLSPPAPTSAPPDAGPSLSELQHWQDVAKIREDRIKELEVINENLLNENHVLSAQGPPSFETIEATDVWKQLTEKASFLEHTLKETQARLLPPEPPKPQSPSGTSDAEQMQKERRAAEEKRIQEGSRLRRQREQLTAELNEVKAQLIKRQSSEEVRALVASYTNRIESYQSEVARLKLLLAANVGDEELVEFIQKEKSGDAAELKKRLIVAEERVTEFEKQLSALSEQHPDASKIMRAESAIRRELVAANKLLNQYRSTYGEPSQLPPDVKQLAEQLRLKEEEAKSLRLQDAQRADAEAALYDEIGKLSTAWESAQGQVNNKVFDLVAAEERIMKANLDKAKADNKFFAAMREKEAVENEHKHLARTNEKLLKHVANLTEVDKTNTHRITLLEQTITATNAKLDAYKTYVANAEADLYKARVARAGVEVNCQQLQGTIDSKRKDWMALVEDIRRKAEALTLAQLTIERQKKAAEGKAAPPSQKEAQLQKEVDKCMSILKCSTCKQNMRSTVLTKCLHTFCKSCIDMRISTRQRKCPACNLAFAQSDAQQLYFQ
ncbi:BRE1 E3 ubiquitin ligase-domain-containing protein [Gloeopeniophorella convolvens]|nr:BRE1 E3 ubiquitin ligase-domain-containing protein [Gloeopeniophorella convolvens]